MIVRLDNLGASGFIPDLPAHDLPEDPLAWSSITNMAFRGGLAERVQGYAASFDTTPTEVAYGLFAVTQSDGTNFLVAAADAAVYSYTGATEANITSSVTVAATADTKWTGGVLTGLLVLNESVNAPVYIAISALGGASDDLAALPNWPSSTLCRVLRPFKYFLVAGGMTEGANVYPYKVRWSTSAVPGAAPASWVAATDNDAGSVDLSADDGPIIDMLDFGDQLAIYRASGITMMRYTGGTEVMAFNRVPSAAGGGLVGNNCVVDVPGIGHVAMSESDIYIFNGTNIQSILDKRMRRWFQSNISPTNGKRSFVFHHATRSEVWCCFPAVGSTACDLAIIWSYVDNTLGVRTLPNCTAGIHSSVTEAAATTGASVTGTWTTITGLWSDYTALADKARKTVLASTANKLYVVGGSDDAAGTAMTSQLERQYISLGDPQRLKYVKSVWPHFDAPTGSTFEIRVGMSMSSDESVNWSASQTYTVGTSRKVNVSTSGRYMSLRIRSTSGGVWRLKSIEVDLEPKGMW